MGESITVNNPSIKIKWHIIHMGILKNCINSKWKHMINLQRISPTVHEGNMMSKDREDILKATLVSYWSPHFQITLIIDDKSYYEFCALTHVQKEVQSYWSFAGVALRLWYEDMRSYSPPLLYESDSRFCLINNR